MSKKDVVKAMYRHFYHWEDFYCGYGQLERRTNYDAHNGDKWEVAILLLSEDEAVKVEHALIMCLKPRDNKYQYENWYKELIKEAKKIIQEEMVIDEPLPF